MAIIRRKTPKPILMLTAMTGESDRIRGLDLGADDYICKPFSISELLSRVHAHLRRVETFLNLNTPTEVFAYGNLTLNVLKHTCSKNGKDLSLNPIEFKMLKYFLSNEGIALSKEKIYENVWEEAYYGDDNTIMVHIRRLREKIEDRPNQPKHLLTVRGVGYKYDKGGN
jgi:DNA-binding response OmpR family regulator